MQYECKPDAFGGEELIMITTVEHIRQLCQPYINEIKNTDLLVSKLLSFINEVGKLLNNLSFVEEMQRTTAFYFLFCIFRFIYIFTSYICV